MISWRRLNSEDLPMLSQWLAEPHVARWWNHDTDPASVERDFGPAMRGEEPSEDFVALLDDEPVGLIQRSRLADYPEYLAEFTAITEVPDDAVTIDYLIGDPQRVGRGLGTRLITSMIDRTWQDLPEVPAIIIAVAAANEASWRALERSGAKLLAKGAMTPDNPIDDSHHHVYAFYRSGRPDQSSPRIVTDNE
ncbi:GNAT family N-acetyltransferase [Amycolatopsis sp. cmx-11-51]|uniref:GNAT family N-acetyltransferase n=1 Tax=unclassified Amycolatopsis TaxID=2618356 RepID=UPI0039E58B59